MFDQVGELLGTITFSDPDLDKLRQEVLKILASFEVSGIEIDSRTLEGHLKNTGCAALMCGPLRQQVIDNERRLQSRCLFECRGQVARLSHDVELAGLIEDPPQASSQQDVVIDEKNSDFCHPVSAFVEERSRACVPVGASILQRSPYEKLADKETWAPFSTLRPTTGVLSTTAAARSAAGGPCQRLRVPRARGASPEKVSRPASSSSPVVGSGRNASPWIGRSQ